jgi:nitrite reductase/ring-hydroxylating ferredoxin subunit
LQSSRTSRLITPLEEWAPLEQASEALLALIQPVMRLPGATWAKDFLHGRWLGHALHPVLVDLPIGFWTSAMLLELVGERKPARVLTAAGSVSALGAAASGLTDWTVTDGRERRLGLLHGLLNLGELVFGRGLMVDHDAWTAGPEDWTRVAQLGEIEDGGIKGVQVDGRTVLLHRRGATVYAMEDTCTHAGGPLHEGTVEDGVVTCPWHASRFRLTDGACLRGPATFPQLRLEARVRGAEVEVRGRSG